jgi:hypothetical protein
VTAPHVLPEGPRRAEAAKTGLGAPDPFTVALGAAYRIALRAPYEAGGPEALMAEARAIVVGLAGCEALAVRARDLDAECRGLRLELDRLRTDVRRLDGVIREGDA